MKAKVVIVDDHKVLRSGLALLLNQSPHFQVVAEASNGWEFVNLLSSIVPDVVLMDINMPVMDGIEATRQALKKIPDLKILVLSMHDEEEYYNTMINAGVKGFVLKETDHMELEQAILSVLNDRPYFSQALLLSLLKKKTTAPEIAFSKREAEILKLMSDGMVSTEIAKRMHMSLRTVEKTRSDLLFKTGTNNSISLILFALRHKLITL
ncbi:MAG: response regulator transcription factor [Breznakibacter sp.]